MAAQGQAPKPAWRENLESFVWAAALALLIRTFVMAPFKIPSGSMHPTLLEGDRILVNKFQHHFQKPQRGDIIVFHVPDSTRRPFIKRLIGLSGDQVEIRDGRVLVNGAPITGAPIFATNQYQNQGMYGGVGQVIEVSSEEFFVLGDNSGSSHDSRFWGFVPRTHLIGKAMVIFWPPQRIRVLR